MADISGFSSAVRVMTEKFSTASAIMSSQKSPWRRLTSNRFKRIATLLETLQVQINLYKNLPKPRRHIEGPNVHRALEKLESPLSDISNDFEGLINRQKLGAVRRRVAALIRSKEFYYGVINVPDHLPEELDKTTKAFFRMSYELVKKRAKK